MEGQSVTTNEPQYNSISVNPKTLLVAELNRQIIERAQAYRDGAEVSNELYYIFCDDFDKQSKETFQKTSLVNV